MVLTMTLTVPPPGQILHWLGGPIQIRVEVEAGLEDSPIGLWDSAEWDTDVWGASDLEWTDVTDKVFSVDIRAGAQRWGERFESASATLVVDNTTGIFTPESGVPFFHKQLRPGRALRVVAIPDEVTGDRVSLFTGQIDSLTDSFDDAGFAIATSVVCSDFISVWSAFNPVMLEVPTGVQSTDERVHAALDRMDWPMAKRNVSTGLHTMQSSFLAQSVFEECARAADAEGGAFYSDRNGVAQFRSRDWLITDPRSVAVQGYLGYDEVPAGSRTAHIVGVTTSHEAARIVNYVTFSRVGSVVQTAEDTDSFALHGRRSYQRMDFENNADVEVEFLAERYLAAFKDDRLRIDSVSIAAVEDDGEGINDLMWDTRFGDRLAVKIQTAWGWDIEKEVHVFALEHRISGSDWELMLTLDDAQTFEGGT